MIDVKKGWYADFIGSNRYAVMRTANPWNGLDAMQVDGLIFF